MEKWQEIMNELKAINDDLAAFNNKPMAIDEGKYTINGKEVDFGSIQIDGVDSSDYPDFCDAYIESATFVDGTELNEDELQKLQDDNESLVNELALDVCVCRADY